MSGHFFKDLKKGLKIRDYPTAGKNAYFLRIACQAIPYYLIKTGYSFPPLSVFIHVNSICNLRCKMCDAGQKDIHSTFYKNLKGGTDADMSIASFRLIIDKVKRFKPLIAIPVLEPMLYPDLSEAVAYVTQSGLKSSVATNGTFLEERAEDLVNSGLSRIVISLDGTEKIHDRIRGVPGTFKKVINGIGTLDKIKKVKKTAEPLVFINYVISELNYSVIHQFVSELPLDSITRVDLRPMFYCTEELANKHNIQFGDKYNATSVCLAGGIDLKKVDADKVYQQSLAVSEEYPGKVHLFFNHGKDELNTYFQDAETFLDDTRCVWPWYTMQVNNDGNVIPFQRCFHNIFGNIIKEEFQSIWNGPKMRQIRQDLQQYGRFPACARCEGVNF
ncbi:radical SAM protein [Candidatus Parcubacteria bacterium]|nr:MAG: radical SAM protein [Candidatus Parcubacteria bacterium]